MENMIKLKDVIKNYTSEELLNCLEVSLTDYSKAKNKIELKKLERELFLYEMEIMSRFTIKTEIKVPILSEFKDSEIPY